MSVFFNKKSILLLCLKFNFFKMIDYLIYDQTRQIRINLELHFERYEFYNFKGYFKKIYDFFLNLIQFILN